MSDQTREANVGNETSKPVMLKYVPVWDPRAIAG